ncbi:MAG: hypothetical protein ACTSP4_01905 [Candidatus Hodarchaeales archaeon]
MSQLDQMMQMFVQIVNNKIDDFKPTLAEWIGPYNGKIIQLEVEGQEPKHLIVRKNGLEMRTGSYPSPDVIYRAKGEVMAGIFTGQIPFRNAMKDGSLWVIAAAHESVPLAKLMFDALQSI